MRVSRLITGALVLIVSLALAIGLTACGGSSDGGGEQAATESDVITLPDGWAIEDVITEDEVGAITGKEMLYFPEPDSMPQDGGPQAGYTNAGTPNTKLYIAVDVAAGKDELDIIKGYAVDGSLQEIPDLGDEAYALAYDDGEVGIILIRGDMFMRIDWPPDVYGDDAVGMGSQLANLVMSKMYE